MADPAPDYGSIYQAAGQEWNVDPTLLRSIAQQESGENVGVADSRAGARGLMQFTDPTAAQMGVENVRDPQQAIYGAAKYMSQLLDKYKTPELALAAYNAGPGTVDSYLAGKGPLPAETQAYVPSVTAKYTALAQPPAAANDSGTANVLARLRGAAAPADASDAFSQAMAPPAKSAVPAPADPFTEALGTPVSLPQFPTSMALGGAGDVASAQQPVGGMALGGASAVTAPRTPPDLSIAGLRADLAPTPGSTYGDVLPIARDADGSVRLALPNSVRSLGNGLLDLAGMRTQPNGLISPEATMALASGALPIGRAPLGALADSTAIAPAISNKLISNRLAQSGVGPGAPNLLGVAAPAERGGVLEQLRDMQAPQPQDGAGPSAGMGGPPPAPSAAGAAATPAEIATMTPAETKAYRRRSELDDARAPAVSGPDNNIYVEGSVPTEAERAGVASVSQQEMLTRQRNPDAFDGPNGRLSTNSTARVNAYDTLASDDVQRQRVAADQATQAQADAANIMRNAKPANAQPAFDDLKAVLDDPRNAARDTVQKYLKPYLNKLQNPDGSLVDDPATLWGIHDDLQEKLSQIAGDPQSTMRYVEKELVGFKQSIDGVMNTATDQHFQTFLDNYAASAQQLNAMNLLQKQRNVLTDGKGNIYPAKFNNFVTNLAQRRGQAGIDPSMDIPDSTMQSLLNINKDLKRAGNIDLGKARGSPTNLLGALADASGMGAAHIATAALGGPGLSNLLLNAGSKAVRQAGGNILVQRRTAKALAPPPGGFRPLPNPTNPYP